MTKPTRERALFLERLCRLARSHINVILSASEESRMFCRLRRRDPSAIASGWHYRHSLRRGGRTWRWWVDRFPITPIPAFPH